MKVLVQRSKEASCEVDGVITGQIEKGLMILVGFCEGDDMNTISYLAKKVVQLRIFEDEAGIMNKSLLEGNGSILSISQFTLYADTKKGNRPSYKNALNGEEAKKLYEAWNEELRKYVHVEEGIFASDMKIHFTNDGPVTILLEKENA